MAITEANLASGTASSVASAASASITPTGNRLVLLAVASRIASGTPNQPTASGNGLTWVAVASLGVAGSLNTRITVFRAMGASPSTGAVTIDFGGQSQTRIEWSIVEFGNVTTAGSNGSGAVVQSNTADSGTAQTAVSLALAAFLSSTNRPYCAIAHNTAEGTTPRTNWAELHDVSTQQPTMETQWRSDLAEATASGSWATSGRGLMVAIEIACADQSIGVTAPNASAAGGAALGGLKATASSSASPTAPDAPASAPAPTVTADASVAGVAATAAASAPAPTVVAGGSVSPPAAGSSAAALAPSTTAGANVIDVAATAAAAGKSGGIPPLGVQASSNVSPPVTDAPAAAAAPAVSADARVTVPTPGLGGAHAPAAAIPPTITADVSAEVDAPAAAATARVGGGIQPLRVTATANVAAPAPPGADAAALVPAPSASSRVTSGALGTMHGTAVADAAAPTFAVAQAIPAPAATATAIAIVPAFRIRRPAVYAVQGPLPSWESGGLDSEVSVVESPTLWRTVLSKG